MYYYLSRAIKRRFIRELQDSFSQHPHFCKFVPYIQDKFAQEERPNVGIVVKNASASKIQFSADNYVGTVVSYCQLTGVLNEDGSRYCGNSIEWIRENSRAVVEHDPTGASFPSPPGIYYIEMTGAREFMVDPLLDVIREFLYEFTDVNPGPGVSVQVDAGMIHPGTLFLFTADDFVLVENEHYTVDYPTGTITFMALMGAYTRVYADYKYPVDSRGPYTIDDVNTYNNTAIPGVVLAFGRAMHEGDKQAVMVTSKREIQALEYGGKWEVSLTFDVLAQDPMQMEEVADLLVMYLWGEKKNWLEFEGIQIIDVNHGGEADEVYDETGQTLYYMASIDMTVQADWNLHVPVPFRITAIEFVEDISQYRSSMGDDIVTVASTLRVVPSLTPYMPKSGLSHNYERIS